VSHGAVVSREAPARREAPAQAGAVLVIGYGNALRTDDGLGWHAAERLAADPRLAGATILRCHQLTPELAFDVSLASFVVFVDADHGRAGGLTVAPIEPAEAALGGPSLTHHLDAGALLALAAELFGARPAAVAVSVGAISMDAGEHLSPGVEAMLAHVVDAVALLAASGRIAIARAARA